MATSATLTPATPAQLITALDFYRRTYGPATYAEMAAAASPRRNFHTLAELTALRAAGIVTRADA